MRYRLNSKVRIYCRVHENGKPLNGLVMNLRISRNSDGFYYDFNDGTFKETGHTAIETTISNPGDGYYEYILDTTGLDADIYYGHFNFIYDDDYRVILSEDYTDETIDNINNKIDSNNPQIADTVWNYNIE